MRSTESLPIDLSSVADSQDKYDDFLVEHVVDDSIVADANKKLPATTDQLDAPRGTWVAGEMPDRIDQSTGGGRVELADDLRRRWRVADRILHEALCSNAEVAHKLFVRDSLDLTARARRTTDVRLILQSL